MVDAGSLRHPTWGALVPERPPVCDWSRPSDGYTRQGTELACTPSLPQPPFAFDDTPPSVCHIREWECMGEWR